MHHVQGSGRAPLELDRPGRVFWLVAAVMLLADQITKSLVRVAWSSAAEFHPLDRVVSALMEARYTPGESVDLIGSAIRLTHVRNTGAAFGLFPGYQPLFILTSTIVLVVVAAYWRRARPAVWPVVIALGLIVGGAVGNLIDRAMFGKVTDFLDAAIIDFPVFNVADSSIVVGVGILVVWLLFGPMPSSGDDGSSPSPVEESSASCGADEAHS